MGARQGFKLKDIQKEQIIAGRAAAQTPRHRGSQGTEGARAREGRKQENQDLLMRRAGVFKAWVLVEARLYAVPLRVPRTFYVNSTRAPADDGSPAATLGGLKVQRTLPFGREAFHLYQVSPALLPRLTFRASLSFCPKSRAQMCYPLHHCGCSRQ